MLKLGDLTKTKHLFIYFFKTNQTHSGINENQI